MNNRPNILLITADQMRWDCLACAGNPIIKTPYLDGLGANGTVFDNAYTPDPICVPARATIMTGNYPQVCTGHKTNSGKIKDDQPLLTKVLKQNGYSTYAVGKLHFVPYSPPGQPRLVHGFEHVDLHESGRILAKFAPYGQAGLEDYYDYLASSNWKGYTRAHGIGNNDVRPCASPLPAKHYVDSWIADRAIYQLENHFTENPERPFFMWMSSPKPHSPYDPPRPYDSMYDPKSLPVPFGSKTGIADRDPILEINRYKHAINSLSPEAWQVIRSYYYGNISFLDAMIGRVLERLNELKQLGNTLIVFTSDHGDLLGDFGSCFKTNMLNGSVRVPFIVSGPGVAKGRHCSSLVGLQDILPTFAAVTGGSVEREIDGIDLSKVFDKPERKVRDVYYSTTRNLAGQTAMAATEDWKYIYSECGALEELYDQRNDRSELTNLADQSGYSTLLHDMRDKLKQCARKFKDVSLFDGKQLVASPLDRGKINEQLSYGMGWRWY